MLSVETAGTEKVIAAAPAAGIGSTAVVDMERIADTAAAYIDVAVAVVVAVEG